MDSKKVTLADIAKKAKLSKSAVSLALNESPMISHKTREKVLKVARSLGYVRNELLSSMMSSMKKGRCASFSETIALVNGNHDEYALTNHPTLPRYCIGIREEAKRLGYAINEFWLHDPRLDGESFSKILRSRGIRGGIILGHSWCNNLPPAFQTVWRDFYFISAGIKTFNPTLEMVSADHYAITYQAVAKAIEHGFKRPALILEEHIDRLVDGRFLAGYMRAQLNLRPSDRLSPFLESDTNPNYVSRLKAWLEKSKPDVILYLLNSTREIISGLPSTGSRTPLIQLEQRGYVPDWMGVEQNNDLVGRVAMRRLADMLNRNSSRIGENANIVTLVPPTWLENSSLSEKKL